MGVAPFNDNDKKLIGANDKVIFCMRIKNRKCNLALAVPLLVAITTPAIGADGGRVSIYEWQDDAGIRHYTNELGDVPDADRNRVDTVIRDWVAPEVPPQDAVSAAPENTAQTTQASPTPVQASSDAPRADVTNYVDASQNSSVVQDTQLVTQQPPLFFGGDLLPEGGRASFARRARPPTGGFQATGPTPQNPAGPPPLGAAGPPPLGAVGRAPMGSAGRRP